MNIGKQEINFSLFYENKVFSLEKIYERKILKFKLIRKSSKAAKYMINIQSSIVFCAAVTTG